MLKPRLRHHRRWAVALGGWGHGRQVHKALRKRNYKINYNNNKMKWLPNGHIARSALSPSVWQHSSTFPHPPSLFRTFNSAYRHARTALRTATTPRVVYWQNFNQKNYNIAANYLRQCRSLSSSNNKNNNHNGSSSSTNKNNNNNNKRVQQIGIISM